MGVSTSTVITSSASKRLRIQHDQHCCRPGLQWFCSGSGHAAFVGVIVNCLFLAGTCSALDLGSMSCLLLLVVLLDACLAIVLLWGMRGMIVQSLLPGGHSMPACSQAALTP